MVGAEPASYAVWVGPFLRYTALRLLLLVLVGAGLAFAGVRGLLWALITVAVTAALSYVLLAGPRDALLERLSRGRAPRRVDEDDEDATAEDAALDHLLASDGQLPEMRERSPQASRPAADDGADRPAPAPASDVTGSRSADAEADPEGHRQHQL